MKTKITVLVTLMAVMLLLCGCGRMAANQGENAAVVTPEATAETVTEETAAPEEKIESPEDQADETITETPEVPEEMTEEKESETVELPEEPGTPENMAEAPAEEEPETPENATEAPAAEEPETPEDMAEVPAAEEAEMPENTAESSEAEEPDVPETAETESEVAEAETVPEVERTITITVPPEYAETTYPFGEIILNMNGSVTYQLTEEEHEELLRMVHDTIQNELDTMCATPYFLHFESMTANEDCTAFKVVVNDIETSKAEQKSVRQIYDFGRMYATYRGQEPGNIHIDYMTMIGNTFVTRDSEKDELYTDVTRDAQVNAPTMMK